MDHTPEGWAAVTCQTLTEPDRIPEQLIGGTRATVMCGQGRHQQAAPHRVMRLAMFGANQMEGRMRKRIGLIAVLAMVFALLPMGPAIAGPKACDTRVNNTIDKLLECVDVDGVREHQAALQAIADANGGTRASGTPGYGASADYVAEKMEAAGYDVTRQVFEYPFFEENVDGEFEQISPNATTYGYFIDFAPMTYSGDGDATATSEGVDIIDPTGQPANTSTSGCEVSDFAGFVAGNIAIIQRGSCSFALKAQNAEAAGATGVVIFNEGQPGRTDAFLGSLGGPGSGIPVVGTSFAIGSDLADNAAVARLFVDATNEIRVTENILAESQWGDTSNVVMAGAHLDSVATGPGIQDNGSGSAAILEVAEQMAKVKPHNHVRFAWWGAEESGLLGSQFYVDDLNQGEEDDIALYLNFDMVGSPNHVFFVYDGDDSDGVGAGPGPEGSAQIEQLFEDFYTSQGEAFKGTDFSGRSDYGPFIAVGIPSGGLFTGAEAIKTTEEAAIWGGTAGDQYDPCYHLACDTFDNVNLHALDVNSDAIAAAVLQYAMNTETINGERGKGNFQAHNWAFGNTE